MGYFRDQCTSTNWENGGCLNICTAETVCPSKLKKEGALKNRLGVDDEDRILMMAETPTQSRK